MKRLLTFCLSFLCLTTYCLGQAVPPAPERELEDFLSSLTKEDLRSLTSTRDKQESSKVGQGLSKTLQAKELGKKWTVKCTSSGNTMQAMENRTALYNNPKSSLIRVNGTQVYVRVRAEVPAARVDKIKDCRAGRKMFVSGTVSEITLYGNLSMIGSGNNLIQGTGMVLLDLTIVADDLGLAK